MIRQGVRECIAGRNSLPTFSGIDVQRSRLARAVDIAERVAAVQLRTTTASYRQRRGCRSGRVGGQGVGAFPMLTFRVRVPPYQGFLRDALSFDRCRSATQLDAVDYPGGVIESAESMRGSGAASQHFGPAPCCAHCRRPRVGISHQRRFSNGAMSLWMPWVGHTNATRTPRPSTQARSRRRRRSRSGNPRRGVRADRTRRPCRLAPPPQRKLGT